MTTRRRFLGSILGLGAAPAIVRAESLMKLWVPSQSLELSEDSLEQALIAIVKQCDDRGLKLAINPTRVLRNFPWSDVDSLDFDPNALR